jgi:protein-S-isoprenylcysteine O-methyltransferase Ste14
MAVESYIDLVWLVVGLVWLILSITGLKSTVRRQSYSARLGHFAIMLVAAGLIFSPRLRPGMLGWHFVAESAAIAWTGFALAVAGCAFAVWARLMLGANWSATVTLKQDHELVCRGPYHIVRHPIYAGLLLALLGTALAYGEIGALLGVCIAWVGWSMKLRVEEAFMCEQFGAAYARYRREVKALIPFVI